MPETPDPIDQMLAEAKAAADREIAARARGWKAVRGRRLTPIFGVLAIVSPLLLMILAGLPVGATTVLPWVLAGTVWYVVITRELRRYFERGWTAGASHQRWRAVQRRQSADATVEQIMRLRRMGPGGGEVT